MSEVAWSDSCLNGLLYSPGGFYCCRSCGEVMSAIVTKCLNASRAKTKEKAMEIIMMYIEIDKHEVVQEELMKGLENKQPKVVYACVQAFRNALEYVLHKFTFLSCGCVSLPANNFCPST